MEYIFLVVAGAWSVQFLLAYYQLQRFHRQLADLRKLGRCSVGLHGNRWRGRTYGVLVADANNRVRHAAVFTGMTVFSKLRPVAGLNGIALDAIQSAAAPIAPMHRSHWAALQHAAQFFTAPATPSQLPNISA